MHGKTIIYSGDFRDHGRKGVPLIVERLQCELKTDDFITYLLSNVFHSRFNDVWPYSAAGML